MGHKGVVGVCACGRSKYPVGRGMSVVYKGYYLNNTMSGTAGTVLITCTDVGGAIPTRIWSSYLFTAAGTFQNSAVLYGTYTNV
jgi:hypothetical protein